MLAAWNHGRSGGLVVWVFAGRRRELGLSLLPNLFLSFFFSGFPVQIWIDGCEVVQGMVSWFSRLGDGSVRNW
jgi:hypothetical protein